MISILEVLAFRLIFEVILVVYSFEEATRRSIFIKLWSMRWDIELFFITIFVFFIAISSVLTFSLAHKQNLQGLKISPMKFIILIGVTFYSFPYE